jgi:hypothetical protein
MTSCIGFNGMAILGDLRGFTERRRQGIFDAADQQCMSHKYLWF